MTVQEYEEAIEIQLENAQNELSDHMFDILLNKIFNIVIDLKNRYINNEEEHL